MDELLALPELRSILRLSLRATATTNVNELDGPFRSTADEEPDFENSPAFKKLVEQIYFSRRFILTYYVVVLVIVAIFSAAHWHERYTRWQRASDRARLTTTSHKHDGSAAASSSSSTLQGTRSPTLGEDWKSKVSERTRLLGDNDAEAVPNAKAAFSQRFTHRLHAFLMYQPSPLPALTSQTNTPPGNGTSILILLFWGVNIFYLLFHTPLSIPMLFAFADRAGLCFVANLPVLYILAAKTNQPIKFLTGWSYEGLNIFHRRLGEWMTALAAMHTVGMFGVWYTLLRPFHFSFLRFLSSRVILLGIFTFIAYLAIYLTSTGYVRQLYYETFLGLHIVLQVSALVLLYFHHHNSRPYVIACFGIWIFDRLVSRLIISTKTFVATLQVADDQETVLLSCNIPIRRFMSTLRLGVNNGWQPGQHVFVTIPGIAWSHRLQAHPFSIASPAPPAGMESGEWPLELIIRAKDGFSKELLDYAKFHQHTRILLDGPYGSPDALEALRHADRKCLIAGGSGIAVTCPLAWDLLVSKDRPDALVSTRTIYENGSRQTIKTKSLHTPSNNDFVHFWIKSSPVHEKWIVTVPKAEALISSSGIETSDTDEVIVVGSLVTDSISTQEEHETDEAVSGRPDVGWMLKNWAETCFEAQKEESGGKESICVVVSGPDGLVRDVRNAAATMVASGWNIEVFVEKFGW